MSSSRTQQLRHIAYHLKMDFHSEEEWGEINYLKDFRLFRSGRRKEITNIFQKRDEFLDLEASIFDYKYVRGGGKNRKTIKQTVFFVKSKRLGLPHFLMKPETFFHRIGTYLGMQDIDFEEYPTFSQNYLLQGEDEEYIRATMDDEVLKFFSVEKDWSVEGVNYYLIIYKKNKLLAPRRIKHLYQKGMDIYKLLVYEPPTFN